MNTFFEKLPFKGMAEKIPAGTRAKVPVLEKAIPFANQIACGVIAFLLVITVANCGGGGNSVKDFKYELNKAGDGIIILDYIGKKGGKVVIPAKIEGYPVVQILANRWVDGESNILNTGNGFKEHSQSTMDDRKKQKSKNKDISPVNGSKRTARITSVVIPNTVTYIGDQAFDDCISLKSITLPKNLKIIGDNAFGGSGLTSITIPEGVTQLGEEIGSVFSFCKKLTSVTLPESLEEIFPNTFDGCSALSIVKLPSHAIKYVRIANESDQRHGYAGEFVRKLNDTSGIYIAPTSNAFRDCPKLSIATRKAITDLGYTSKF